MKVGLSNCWLGPAVNEFTKQVTLLSITNIVIICILFSHKLIFICVTSWQSYCTCLWLTVRPDEVSIRMPLYLMSIFPSQTRQNAINMTVSINLNTISRRQRNNQQFGSSSTWKNVSIFFANFFIMFRSLSIASSFCNRTKHFSVKLRLTPLTHF